MYGRIPFVAQATPRKQRVTGRIIPPRLLLVISMLGLVVIAASVVLEYRARQQDFLKLLEHQASMFVKTLSSSAQSALRAAEEFEGEINSRIFATLGILERLDRTTQLTESAVSELVQIGDLDEVHLYDGSGRAILRVSSDRSPSRSVPAEVLLPRLETTPINHVFTLYDFPETGEERIVFLVPRERGGFVAALMRQERMSTMRQLLGFGYFLKRFRAEENVEYIALQNSETIIAGSFEGYELSSFTRDPLLSRMLTEGSIKSRILKYNGQPVYETISPFNLLGEPVGVLRLGLSLQEYERLTQDVKNRLYLFAASLIIFGLIFVNFTISYRHRHLLRKNLDRLQDYTNTVLENLQSGVISLDQDGRIQSVNRHALKLLGKNTADFYGRSFTILPDALQDSVRSCLSIDREQASGPEERFVLGWNNRNIQIRASVVQYDETQKTCILLLDDITEQMMFEKQVRLNEKLTALQSMASAVAHEIRNPLNSIRLIIDLIRKKSRSGAELESTDRNLETVQKEIGRINAIVEQYLRFGRLPELNVTSVSFPVLLKEIRSILDVDLRNKQIELRVQLENHPVALGDPDQLKQIFTNLVKNAEEAIGNQGRIEITGSAADSFYEIRVSDSGKGIPERDIKSIFNLRYTTKREGSGIGLAIVQNIVSAHQGSIEVHSKEGEGTTFILRFPLPKAE
jgi:PAS domain S-box-containing protein